MRNGRIAARTRPASRPNSSTRLVATAKRAGGKAAKVCGAGGGGCVFFLVEPDSKAAVQRSTRGKKGREMLDVKVAPEAFASRCPGRSLMEATIPSEKLGLVLRIGLYAFLAYVGLCSFLQLLALTGILIAGAVGTFLAAAAANAITVRIFERGRLSDMGSAGITGLSAISASASPAAFWPRRCLSAPALLFGAATVQPDPEYPASFSSSSLSHVPADYSAHSGKRCCFRGYAFQTLVEGSGPFSALLPTSLLFAFAHAGNQSVSGSG